MAELGFALLDEIEKIPMTPTSSIPTMSMPSTPRSSINVSSESSSATSTAESSHTLVNEYTTNLVDKVLQPTGTDHSSSSHKAEERSILQRTLKRLGTPSYDMHPLQLSDNEEVLIICSGAHQGIGYLTETGARMLHAANPKLFPKEIDAALAFKALGLYCASYKVDTEEYQAIARLIEQHEEADSLRTILCCANPSFESAAGVERIPFGLFRHNYLVYFECDNVFFPDARSSEHYQRFLNEQAFLSSLRNVIERKDWCDRTKIDSLRLLFPPDKELVTLDEVMQNADCLLGHSYEQAKRSFQEHSAKQNEETGRS